MAMTLKVPANRFDHHIGSLNAPVILVEYGDLENSDTARALKVTDKLVTEFRDKLCFVFRHFPLPDTSPHAVMASLACEAANTQGMFWKMFRHILKHHDELSASFFAESANRMKLDTEQFIIDMESEELLFRIQQDINSGEDSGVDENTPSFFLNGILMEYPTNYDILRDEIQSLIDESTSFSDFL